MSASRCPPPRTRRGPAGPTRRRQPSDRATRPPFERPRARPAARNPTPPSAPGGRPRRPRPRPSPPRPGPRGSRTPRPAGSTPCSSSAAVAIARATGCSDACSSAPASRRASARSAPSAAVTPTRLMRPVVTVPVLSSTTVSIVRVDSSTSGPLISRPSWAPRPVPTMSAVGVASPSAHGQAMISTATAAVNAKVALSPVPSQKPSVATASADHDRHEDAGHPIGEPLHRRLAGLRLGDQPSDLGECGVGADLRGAHDEPPAGVRPSPPRPRRPGRSPRRARTRP